MTTLVLTRGDTRAGVTIIWPARSRSSALARQWRGFEEWCEGRGLVAGLCGPSSVGPTLILGPCFNRLQSARGPRPVRPGHIIRVAPSGQLKHRRAIALGVLDGSRGAVGHARSPDARPAIDGFVNGPAIDGVGCALSGEHAWQ